MAWLCGLVDLSDKVKGNVKPSDRNLFSLLFELLEVERYEIFEEVITSIDTLHVQLFELKFPQFS